MSIALLYFQAPFAILNAQHNAAFMFNRSHGPIFEQAYVHKYGCVPSHRKHVYEIAVYRHKYMYCIHFLICIYIYVYIYISYMYVCRYVRKYDRYGRDVHNVDHAQYALYVQYVQ